MNQNNIINEPTHNIDKTINNINNIYKHLQDRTQTLDEKINELQNIVVEKTKNLYNTLKNLGKSTINSQKWLIKLEEIMRSHNEISTAKSYYEIEDTVNTIIQQSEDNNNTKNNCDISNSSLKSYSISLNKLKNIGINLIEIDNDYDINKILDACHYNNIPNNSIKTYLSAILWFIRQIQPNSEQIQKLTDEIKNLKDIIGTKYEENSLTETEKEKFVNWSTIMQVYKKLHELSISKNTQEHDKDFLLLSLYTCKEPARIKDYSLMYVTDSKTGYYDISKNYYVVTEDIFVMNVYKTKKFCGIKKVNVGETLNTIIKAYIEKYEIKIGESLLNLSDNNCIKRLLKIFQIYINKNISASMLRHIFITHQKNLGNSDTIEKKKELCDNMCHTLYTQSTYYKLIDEKDPKFNVEVNEVDNLHNKRGRPRIDDEEKRKKKNEYNIQYRQREENKIRIREYQKAYKENHKQKNKQDSLTQ